MTMNDNELERLQKKKTSLENELKEAKFKGYPEVKVLRGKKYIYLRYKEYDTLSSTYAGVYTDELFNNLKDLASTVKKLRSDLRVVNNILAKHGISDKNITPNTRLNIQFVRGNLDNIIYGQSVVEGIAATFLETKEVLENGVVKNLKSIDVQKLLNLKRAWQYALDEDTYKRDITFYSICSVAGFINDNLVSYGDQLRTAPATIGGTDYQPPIPKKEEYVAKLTKIMNNKKQSVLDNAVDLFEFICKSQGFPDGNKRTALIFSNMYLIKNGKGLLEISERKDKAFKNHLLDYYENKNNNLKTFLIKECFKPLDESLNKDEPKVEEDEKEFEIE